MASAPGSRVKIRGLGKGVLIRRVRDFSKTKLGLEVPNEFLNRFHPRYLYGAMLWAQKGQARGKVFDRWFEEHPDQHKPSHKPVMPKKSGWGNSLQLFLF